MDTLLGRLVFSMELIGWVIATSGLRITHNVDILWGYWLENSIPFTLYILN